MDSACWGGGTCGYECPVTPGFTEFSLFRLLRAHLQVDDCVGAVALHGEELQVPLEVLGVETGDGQTVAEAGLFTREGCNL